MVIINIINAEKRIRLSRMAVFQPNPIKKYVTRNYNTNYLEHTPIYIYIYTTSYIHNKFVALRKKC